MIKRLGRLSVVAVFFLSLASFSSLRAQSSDGLSDGVNAQITALLQDKAERTPAQRKIDPNLIYASRIAHGQPAAPGVNSLQTGVSVDTNLRVVVDIVAPASDSLLERLNQVGAKVLDADFRYRNVRAEVSLDTLETIAGWSDVVFIHRQQLATTLGNMAKPEMPAATRAVSSSLLPKLNAGFPTRAAVVRAKLEAALQAKGIKPQAKEVVNVSEGRVTHRADLVVTNVGVIGAGVKVGVLSDGVNSLSAVQATGDLPGVTVLPGQAGGGDEGTAMLEIVHDLAPGAKLYFATAFRSITSFAQNIQDLRAAGCDIIVDDVFYFVETPFQKGQASSVGSTTNGGIVIQAVANVTASGALFFSSAGNSGNKDDGTSGTWEGDFVSGGAVGPPIAPGETGLVHSFGATNYDSLASAAQIINLYWSDPLGGSPNDYDLFILNAAGTAILAASTASQNGSQDPYEQVFSGGGFPTGARCVIVQFSGTGRFLHLSTNRGTLSVNTPGETHGHSATPSPFAFTVAATPAAAAFGPGYPTGPFPGPFNTGNHIELFSSDGLRRVFFNADSSPITPGNFSSTGGQVLQKPDFTAADGVSCAAPGFNPFFGTSAAAPHAAAIAALVKSAAPGFTQTQIANALTSTAIDIEGAGTDRDSGAGILDALSAVQSTGATPQAAPLLGTLTSTDINGNGNGFVEPGECGGLTVQLVNGNAAVAMTNISAALTTSTPGVTIDVANATYPNIPGGGNAVNTPQFRFRLSNLVACPLIVNFAMTVTYTGGPSPLILTFSLRTGSPPVVVATTLDTTAPPSVSGIYTGATGLQTSRLGRNGLANVCPSPKANPGTLGTGTRQFDSYTFTNCASSTACISVDLEQDASATLQVAAYRNSFDPANILTNYAGDAGGSAPSTNFSFTVNPGQTFIVTVNEVNSGGGIGKNYGLTVDGICLPCATFPTSGSCCPTITVSPASIPSGVSGVPYPTTVITPSGGVAPYTFSVTGLPPGLTATPGPTSVTISGTPLGSFSGTVTVSGTDANGCPFSRAYPLTVTCDPATPAQATIGTATPVCAFTQVNTATVTVPAAPDPPGTTYSWTITNGTITAGQGTRTITYTAGANGPIQLSVNIIRPDGCNFYGNAAVTVNRFCGNFFTVTPCRIIDTRSSGPALAAGSTQTFTVAGGTCGIPFTARAASINVTVTNVGAIGNLQIFPGGNPVPLTSVINYDAGRTRANNAIVTLGPGGTITVKCNQGVGTTDLILDVNGYFQ